MRIGNAIGNSAGSVGLAIFGISLLIASGGDIVWTSLWVASVTALLSVMAVIGGASWFGWIVFLACMFMTFDSYGLVATESRWRNEAEFIKQDPAARSLYFERELNLPPRNIASRLDDNARYWMYARERECTKLYPDATDQAIREMSEEFEDWFRNHRWPKDGRPPAVPTPGVVSEYVMREHNRLQVTSDSYWSDRVDKMNNP